MIKGFAHRGLRQFFESGTTRGINPQHAARLQVRLDTLNRASNVRDMDLPGWRLHELRGDMAGRWSVTVSGNWRLTFEMEDGDAYVVDYEDYH